MKFTNDIPLKKTMVFEDQYHENLQMDLKEKKEIINNGIAFWLLSDSGDFIGEIYAICLDQLDEEIEGNDQVKTPKDKTWYLYSVTIMPKYRRKGFAKIMMAYMLGFLKNEGAISLLGHYKEGTSSKLAEMFGGKFLGDFANWYETGATHKFYEISI